jgi:hypothetical protein
MALSIASQTAAGAGAAQTIYTSTGDTEFRSLVVCNRSGTSATFRLSITPSGASNDQPEQYLFYDMPIVPNDSFTSALEIGVSLGDVVRFYASTANLTVTLFKQ